MARILVISEPTRRSITKTTLGILEKLADFDTEVAIIGKIDRASIDLIQKYGVTRINLLKGDCIKKYSPEAYSHALNTFIENNSFDVIIGSATPIGQDIFPNLSARYGTALASGVNDFFFKDKKLFGTKRLYNGKCIVDIELLGPKPWFITIVPGALNSKNKKRKRHCKVLEFNIPDCDIHAQVSEISNNPAARPPLEDADIIVAGGRGMGNGDKLSILAELADTLGAALGASGGAVDSDFAPKEYLIGQSGTRISPLLYIACGISGAVHHIAGIRNAKKILAINTDANAPLMKMADYAIIGNLHDIVPAITKQLSVKRHDDLVE